MSGRRWQGSYPRVFNEYLTAWQDKYNPLYKTLDDVPPYWWEDAAALVRAGAVKGDGINSFGLRRSELKVAIVSKRYADFLLSKGNLRAGRQSRDSKGFRVKKKSLEITAISRL